MAALRSQQADCFLEFLQASCTSCKQELSRSVALPCQVLWVTQTLINKIILQKQRKLVSNYPESWRAYGNHCWENQIRDIFSLPQFLYVLSWVIERKHWRLHPQLQGHWIQTIFLLSDHNMGHLVLWLGTKSCISNKNIFLKKCKIHPLLTFSERVQIFHFSPTCFVSWGTCKIVCNVLSFLDHWSWTSFHDLPWIWTFFYSFICPLWNCDSFG